jgi:hypothetical protein
MKTLVVIAAVLAAGCSNKDGGGAGGGGGACKPLSVTVDGTALAAMPHGLAKANNRNGDVSYEVTMLNHDKATCAQLLDKAGRQIPDGELSVRAFAGGAGMTGKGVAIDAHTQMGGAVSLVGGKPTAVGDRVKVCADSISFKPVAGAYKDKQVVITGLFEGAYCGEMAW